MLRVSELHWWEGRHRQCCTFSSIAGAQHQPHEEKEGRSHETPALGEGGGGGSLAREGGSGNPGTLPWLCP